jgi:low temperature requirement protein LtrA
MPEGLQHSVRRMVGRDPAEHDRASTPLELLFDLTFVIAFGVASDELAHQLVAGQAFAGIVGFLLATFAISWAWVNFSWFASAYDTDDWVFRLTTMVQMVGVLVLALGLTDLFESLVEGDHLDNRLVVTGYVIMRVPMVLQWLRAGREDPERRELCRLMVISIVVTQVGWVLLLVPRLSVGWNIVCFVALVLAELCGPLLAETRYGGTPWHGRHIAERYGLVIIIALGEGLLGTTATLKALVDRGWTLEIGLLGLAGVAMIFGVWWNYFVIPYADLLASRRDRGFTFGYGHIPVFGAVVAIGAGLHCAAYALDDDSELGTVGTVATVAVPMGVYLVGLYLLFASLSRQPARLHLALTLASVADLVVALLLAAAGASLVASLVVVAIAPWILVVGYETRGHRHHAELVAEPG